MHPQRQWSIPDTFIMKKRALMLLYVKKIRIHIADKNFLQGEESK